MTLFGGKLPASHTIVRQGMARTFQHVQLVPTLSVLDNVALGALHALRSGGNSDGYRWELNR